MAGISIGLVKEGDRAALLTDILGAEDGMGDMDFKVAGTRKGITGFQVDLKIRGLSFDLARGAFEEARIARYSILDEMAKVLPAPRKEMSRHAPRILTVRVATEKIGAIIGPGGKTINKITAETGVEIDIQDTGEVFIFSSNAEASERAAEMIRGLTAEAEVGKSYHGKVVSIKEFGAFVEYMPGKDGMVHVSEMADFRVNRVEDVCKVGDDMWVKIIEVDDRGRVRLSRKAALEERDAVARGEPVPEYKPQPRESRDSRGPRPDSRGPRPDSRQDSRGPRSDSRGPRSDSRQDSRPDSRQDSRPDSRQDTRPDTRPDSRGPRPDYRGGRPDAREARPEPREARPEQRPPPAHGTPAAFVGGDDIPVRDGGED